MKLFLYSVIFLSVSALGCSSSPSNENSQSAEGSTSPEPQIDTVIYSSPDTYRDELESAKEDQKIYVSSYKQILELFDQHHYTPETWQAGIREVPRIYYTSINEKWRTETSKEIVVQQKKQLFFRGLAPLVLRANEKIMKDRNRLKEYITKSKTNDALAESEIKWLSNLATLYKVDLDESHFSEGLNELWNRVDIIPASLALSQGAEESGWGTSRFASTGNAIYGQWTWGSNAIKPKEQRKELGNYGIAAFGSLFESVSSYMLNLNTHNAYSSLRDKRAELRKNGSKITGIELAKTLTKYSERGEDYVKGLISLINYNKLAPADDAYLADETALYMIPAED